MVNPTNATTDSSTRTLNISGMSCEHCQRAVKEALESVAGTGTAEVDLASGRATVAGDADLQALIAAVEEEGYRAEAAR